jgi:hypothetical protein
MRPRYCNLNCFADDTPDRVGTGTVLMADDVAVDTTDERTDLLRVLLGSVPADSFAAHPSYVQFFQLLLRRAYPVAIIISRINSVH